MINLGMKTKVIGFIEIIMQNEKINFYFNDKVINSSTIDEHL